MSTTQSGCPQVIHVKRKTFQRWFTRYSMMAFCGSTSSREKWFTQTRTKTSWKSLCAIGCCCFCFLHAMLVSLSNRKKLVLPRLCSKEKRRKKRIENEFLFYVGSTASGGGHVVCLWCHWLRHENQQKRINNEKSAQATNICATRERAERLSTGNGFRSRADSLDWNSIESERYWHTRPKKRLQIQGKSLFG